MKISRMRLISEIESCYSNQLKPRNFEIILDDASTPFPLGFYRRKKEDGGFDLIEFQFDKYGSSKFVINYGRIGKDGYITEWGDKIEAENARPSDAPECFRIFASSSLFGKKWFFAKNETDLKNLILKTNSALLSVCEWFDGGNLPPLSIKI